MSPLDNKVLTLFQLTVLLFILPKYRSNTLDFYTRVAPLGLGFFGIPVFYTHAGSLSPFLFGRLIPAGAKNLYP